MATEMERRPVGIAAPRVPLAVRLFGLGSAFGKTLRDSRLSITVVAAVLGGIILAGGATMANTYGTLAARRELADLSSTLPPVLEGLYGNPVRVDTLGGFISWHYGAYFALLAGLWSILALSSTLATEARRGSLDFVLGTPVSRRRVALGKVAGHVVAMGVAAGIVAALTWLTGVGFARLPGDAIAPADAITFAIGLALKALAAGALAFAFAAILGRTAGAGLAGAVMVGGYVLNSYRLVVPAFEGAANLTWFAWTRDFLPLAGQSDWVPLTLVAGVTVAFLAVGIEVFARRDVGITGSRRSLGLPRAIRGTHGPLGRSAAELLPAALAWGIGLGLYGFVMAASSQTFTKELIKSPDLVQAVQNMVPGIDITTAAGFLQLAFVDMGLVLAGLAAATLVGGRSVDESGGRLEMLLATPLGRARWAVASGVAVSLTLWLSIAVLAASVAVGVGSTGQDWTKPAMGMIALALYGSAIAGIGIAAAGLLGSWAAVPVTVAVAIGTFLVDLLAPALRLPDWVSQVALSNHLGQPMIGQWDGVGLMLCIVLAVGGVAVGAAAMQRRDVQA